MTPEQAAQLIDLTRLQIELAALERDQFAEAMRWLLFMTSALVGAMVADI